MQLVIVKPNNLAEGAECVSVNFITVLVLGKITTTWNSCRKSVLSLSKLSHNSSANLCLKIRYISNILSTLFR